MPSPSEHQDPEQHVWFSGNLMTIKHRRGWTLIESQMAAGHAPPLHVHRNEDEAFYVLEGSMRLARGDEIRDLGPGDFAVVPQGVPHAFVVGPEGARTLEVATGTDLAAFIEDAGEPAAAPTMPTGQSIDREALAAAAAGHGIVEVGPPLALD